MCGCPDSQIREGSHHHKAKPSSGLLTVKYHPFSPKLFCCSVSKWLKKKKVQLNDLLFPIVIPSSLTNSSFSSALWLAVQVQPVPHAKEKFLVWTTISSQWRNSWSWKRVEPYWRLEHMKVYYTQLCCAFYLPLCSYLRLLGHLMGSLDLSSCPVMSLSQSINRVDPACCLIFKIIQYFHLLSFQKSNLIWNFIVNCKMCPHTTQPKSVLTASLWSLNVATCGCDALTRWSHNLM